MNARAKTLLSLFSDEIFWAALGAAMLLNAFLSKALFEDGGVNAAICAFVALCFLVPPLLRIVYDDFKHRRVHMNELALIAVVAGAGKGDLMTAGLIAFFMLIGLIIETRGAGGAKQSLERVARMTQVMARRVLKNGDEEEVAPDALVPGDLLRVRPGETIPADGEILRGESSFQEAGVTGESLPADKGPADKVFAGTINLTGVVEIAVSRTGADTTLGKVRELVLSAERSRPRLVRVIDQWSVYYTPLTLIFAFFLWTVTDHDLSRVVAALVAACPIAFVLSSPSAGVAALSAGARLGLLIKKVTDIEALYSVTSFVFDKTGTLTTGALEVTELAPVDGVTAAELLTCAASAEQHSNHPVAKATRALAQKVRAPIKPANDVSERPGRGVKAAIDGETVIVGNPRWLQENGARLEDFPDFASEKNSGMSLLFVLRGQKALGWIALSDRLMDGAKDCVEALREQGVRHFALVTGDREGVAAKVAGDLAIKEYYGDRSPAEKVEKIQEFKDKGHKTVFVGDGVNDAPALAGADIGIAMGAAGSDLAIETASIALMNNELDRLPFLLRLAAGYRAIMVQNALIAGLTVFFGVTAASTGYLTAVPAACLQVIGAVVVVMNSARLVRSGENLGKDK